MAILHPATITPTKAELVAAWIGGQVWAPENATPFELVGAYRFDDPAGEVGIEAHVLRTSSGRLLHVPLTYRGVEAPELAAHLVGTMEHTVLGRRWVYDGAGDPVFVSTATAVITEGEGQATEEVHHADGSRSVREPTVTVAVHGHHEYAGDGRLCIVRVLDPDAEAGQTASLVGTWADQHDPVVLIELVTS